MQFSYVFFQVKVPAKAFSASPTREGLLVVMRVHVEGQIVYLMEGLVAYGTFVLLLSAVRKFVVLVIS